MDISSLSAWLTDHSGFILPAIAIIAFVESFAIAGIIVPGVALLFSVAALASLSNIPLFDVLVAAFIGAVAGDVISFAIGRVFHDILKTKWPFSKYPEAMAQGEAFFEKYGSVSVVIGRFIGPLRPVLPITAGMLHMNPLKFVIINILSACAWAPFYILPGYLGAEVSQGIIGGEHAVQTAWLSLALVLVLLPWAVTLKLVPIKLGPIHPLVTSLVYSLVGFITIIALVLLGSFDRIDVWLLSVSATLRNAQLDPVLVFITTLGDEALLTALFMASVVYLLFNRQRDMALCLALAGVTASITTHLIKYGLSLPRPDFVSGLLSTASFPSGHTSGVSIFAGTLCGLFIQRRHTVKAWIKASVIAIMLVVASSRVLLGVHWLSDILGGLLLGNAISCAVLLFAKALSVRAEMRQQAVQQLEKQRVVTLGCILIAISALYLTVVFEHALLFYAVRH